MSEQVPEERRPVSGAAPPASPSRAKPVAAGPDATVARPAADPPFGATLEPILRAVCDGRLSPVSWFRTDWQRGGALTGYAGYRGDDGAERPAVVKLPVAPAERDWLLRLQDRPDLVPAVYRHGDSLHGYDLAWVVMERLPHGPLGVAWGGDEFDLLAAAAGRFYAAARRFPLEGEPAVKDWEGLFYRSREHVQRHELAHGQRWKNALKRAHRKLGGWVAAWEARPAEDWCHGDLHLANAMTRRPAPEGPAVLLDFAQCHRGHWVEDAIYFEHLFWCRPSRLGQRKLCRLIAHERKRWGLPVDPDWPRYAAIRRGLLAMSTPAMLRHDGDPHHVEAALGVLEAEGSR